MAACAAVVSERPVACIPCCGSVSPDVMVTGFMRWQHDWSTLRADAAAARSLTSLTAAAAGISEHAPAQAEEAADGSRTLCIEVPKREVRVGAVGAVADCIFDESLHVLGEPCIRPGLSQGTITMNLPRSCPTSDEDEK